MKRFIFMVMACLICMPLFAQTQYEEITSSRLSTVRKIKIKLPKDYDPDSELKHPVIIVFDGDYLFEPIAGQVDFQTYFDDMPSSIVVGIVQGKDRSYDGYCDEVTGLPKESGLRFHQFVAEELVPYLDNRYNTSEFRVAVGHDLMGNFINSYLFKEDPLFRAYVSISPDLSGTVKDYLGKRLEFFKKDIFYYMATADKDLDYIRETVLTVDSQISEVKNKYLTYYFDDFKNDSHYTLVSSAIARSFDKIFDMYKPLGEKELREKVLPYNGTLDKYLKERCDRIEDFFGVVKTVTDEEFEKVAKIAEERNDVESFKTLGKMAKKINPESLLGTYYLAQYAEKIGKTKRAKKLYEIALELEDVSHINRDFIFSKIDELTVVEAETEEEEEEIVEEDEEIDEEN